jgi:2-dehydropantoate 2-reductase
MRVLVVGAGAVGSVLGGFLARAGCEVTLLGRPWHLEVVRQQGLRLSGLWGEHVIAACPAQADRSAMPIGNPAARRGPCVATATRLEELEAPRGCDWIFVCVKAYQTAQISRMLPALLGPATLVCAFQNGLGNYDTLIRAVSAERVALGRVIFGAEIEPGGVRVTVCADEVLIGSPDERFPQDRAVRLAAALQRSGIPARTTSAILEAVWAKALYNCALNGLSAVLEVPYGRLPDHPLAPGLMRAIIHEAYAAAATHGVRLEPATSDAYTELLFSRLIPETAAHHSSMLQDLGRGRPTEVDALNGAMVRLAQAAGLTAPANALVTRLVHEKERFLGIAPPDDPGGDSG